MISCKYTFATLAVLLGAVSLGEAPAHAISFTLGDENAIQASMQGIAGFNGETDQGAYSIFARDEGYNTVNFNNNDFAVINSGNSVVTGAGIQYSYVGDGSDLTGITQDEWAPNLVDPRDNQSSYLTAFNGTDVQIDLDETHNYFGINWGSAHDGNEFAFYNGDTLLQKFVYYGDERTFAEDSKTTNVAAALKQYGVQGNANQYNAYFNFFAESENDVFNRIVISQAGSGGFETDNHTFYAGSDAFDPEAVPEPAGVLGLLVFGGLMLRARQNQQAA